MIAREQNPCVCYHEHHRWSDLAFNRSLAGDEGSRCVNLINTAIVLPSDGPSLIDGVSLSCLIYRSVTEYNDRKQALLEAEDELAGLEARVEQAKLHLTRLQHTNVLNTTFPIWYDGHIGVINGLHLGRLANRPVSNGPFLPAANWFRLCFFGVHR